MVRPVAAAGITLIGIGTCKLRRPITGQAMLSRFLYNRLVKLFTGTKKAFRAWPPAFASRLIRIGKWTGH